VQFNNSKINNWNFAPILYLSLSGHLKAKTLAHIAQIHVPLASSSDDARVRWPFPMQATGPWSDDFTIVI